MESIIVSGVKGTLDRYQSSSFVPWQEVNMQGWD